MARGGLLQMTVQPVFKIGRHLGPVGGQIIVNFMPEAIIAFKSLVFGSNHFKEFLLSGKGRILRTKLNQHGNLNF